MSAHEGVALAHTVSSTGEVAEVLIILLRTLAPAVTHVCHVQTDSGASTAVQTRAGGIFTLMLVIVTRTVIDIIAAHKQRKAVSRT